MKSQILVVDDHSIVRLGIENLITKKVNAQIYGAANLEESRSFLKETSVDLIILDIGIPDWVGMSAISELKELSDGAGLLICSAHSEFVYALRCMDAGADGYLQKTIQQEEMAKAILTVLNGEQYISDHMKDYILDARLNKKEQQLEDNPLNLLTEREMEVCGLLQKGLKNSEISSRLRLHASTVSTYKIRIFQKLKVNNINELVEKMRIYDPFIG